jgi:hypothetical protein
VVGRNRQSITTGDIEYRFLLAAIGIPTFDDLQALQRHATRILLSLNDKKRRLLTTRQFTPLQHAAF